MVAISAAPILDKEQDLPIRDNHSTRLDSSVVYLPGEEPFVTSDTETQGEDVGGTVKKKSFLDGFFPFGSKIGAKRQSVVSTKESVSFAGREIEDGLEAAAGRERPETVEAAAVGDGAGLLPGSVPSKVKTSLFSSVSPLVLLAGVAVPVAAIAIGVSLWGQSAPQKHVVLVAPKTTLAGAGGIPGTAPSLIAPSANLATVAPREAVDPPPRQVSADQTPTLDAIFALRAESVLAPESGASPNGPKVQHAAEGSKAAPVMAVNPAGEVTEDNGAGLARGHSAEPVKVGSAGAQPVRGKSAVQVDVAAVAEKSVRAARGAEEPGLAPAQPTAVETPADKRHADNEALALVTELGTLLKEVRTEVAALKVQDRALRVSVEAKIADFDRRLDLKEAKETIEKIKSVDLNPPDAKPAEAAPIVVGPKVVRVGGSKPKAAPPVQEAEARKTYRIQAASPGLAMLVEANNSGDDAPLISVSAGHELSGYGKVLKIEQEGSSWKIRTEHGTIQ